MRHFEHFSAHDSARLFLRRPEPFDACSPLATLSVSLGATLYCPATRPALADDIAAQAAGGVTSLVVCLEDAISDTELPAAERNAVEQLRLLNKRGAPTPLLFLRVRAAEQIPMLMSGLGDAAELLTGFVLPKFGSVRGPAFLDAVRQANRRLGATARRPLLVMPVLESPEVMFAETRAAELQAIARLLEDNRDLVLAVRVGATDLSAVYGLRRSPDHSAYDIRLLADVIADIVNVLGRADGSGHVITGPVWEHFSGSERLLKPQLRESPFSTRSQRDLRADLVAEDLDGLLREIELDKANGLTGKTVIHPKHVAAVHALLVVTFEEWKDASDIIGSGPGGGVSASSFANKMNESRPHTAWANRILARARLFGVANPDVSYVHFLHAGLS